MTRAIVTTAAPAAIGTYSQGIISGDCIYLSGQIPLDPTSQELIAGDMRAQLARVFDNLTAVAAAAVATLDDCVKLTVYLTDLDDFALVNEVMAQYFRAPYPARAVRGAAVEIDAILTRRA